MFFSFSFMVINMSKLTSVLLIGYLYLVNELLNI